MRLAFQHLIQLICRVCMRVWFRRLEVVGGERLATPGPLLIVASHFNGMLDPALIGATSPRFPRFLAKSTLWHVPVLGRMLDAAGALPVQRAAEGDTASNERIFAACYEALRDGESIAIFPEGRTHDELSLQPLRTGAARLALGARQAGAAGLRILPVGLVYLGKGRARGRALVRVGEPIDLDGAIGTLPAGSADEGPGNREAVRCLTDEIQDRLTEAALDFPGPTDAVVAAEAAAVALRPVGAPHAWEPPLDELERVSRRIACAAEEDQQRVAAAHAVYRDSLSILGLTDADLVAGDLSVAAWRIRLAQLPLVVAAMPVALVGTVTNGLPAGAVWAAGAGRRQPLSRGTTKLSIALGGFPMTWFALHRLVRRGYDGRYPGLVTLALGPGCGLVAIAFVDRVRSLRNAREGMRRLRAYHRLVPALLSEREEVAEAVAAVAGLEEQRARPPATARRTNGRSGSPPARGG